MECGISCDQFYDMSYGDLLDTISAVHDRNLHELQRLSGLVFRMVHGVATGVNAPKQCPVSQAKMFPELFGANNQLDWHTVKDNMQRYKQTHNKKIGGEK